MSKNHKNFCRKRIGESVHFSSVTDKKFKHNRISALMVLPMVAEEAADNAVVPLLLRKGSRECPDFSSLNARLCELYGAELDADVGKWGGYQILEVSIKALDDRYALENEDVTAQCAQLLASILLDAKLDEQGCFDAQDVALERQFVIDSLEAEINEKRSYAMLRCTQEMCGDEPVAVRRYGTIELAEKITPESAGAAYRKMLETASVEILFTGSGDPAAAVKIFEDCFATVKRSPVKLTPYRPAETAERTREVAEEMELSQSKLVMGLRTGKIDGSGDYNALRVFTAMLGGTTFSKLFLNVREKLSLCYYCAARFDGPSRLLFIDSGIEAKNKQKAQDEIMAQIAAIADSDFTDEELFNTKMIMRNQILSSGDSLSGSESWYLSQILRGQEKSPVQDCADLDAVTREQVVRAAGNISLDTVYLLQGSEEEQG